MTAKLAMAKTSNGKGNSRFLHCDAHDETVSIFGRNDGIWWIDGIWWVDGIGG
jgi:hypothetical protein